LLEKHRVAAAFRHKAQQREIQETMARVEKTRAQQQEHLDYYKQK
jgi:hypothetical protein